ncbi:DMT family transporter [Anaerosacchariphilus polymeriproducens]|uniref:DMT family transporter n=1 Tax=Anaerosacchariphilus polymeriproducens TaxID=1812858 RepID=A0A371AZN5_9FIRM|nr:DMT family transporter [Anaerosacchariphilus polymeriproducens]RDU25003.1 DMT family transporter [Anaerosacchariphilus polymeriproducens]
MKTLEYNSQKKLKGIFFIILSAFCFACMSIFVRLSGNLPAYEKSFFRNLIAFFIAVILMIKSKNTIKIKIKKQDWIDIMARAIFGCIGIVCNFYAIDHMLVADASALNKLSPFFVIIFSFFILKEKVKLKQIFFVIIAFIGMLFILKPGFAEISLLPALAGISGGMCAGLAYTFVRKLGSHGVPGAFIVLFFSAFSCISMIPMMIAGFHVASREQIVMLLGAGVAAAGGQFSITAAYTYAPAREISIYDYFQIIFITILSYFILDEVPDAYSFIGYLIILFASLAMFFYNKRK